MLTISAASAPKVFSANAKPPPRVVVIGGGAGGLASAGRLSKAGCDVTLLEKNAELGGRVQSEHIDGYRFDTGPSLLLFPHKYEETFEALGIQMASVVDIRRVEPAAYRVFFPSSPGYTVDLLNNPEDMAAQLERLEKGAGDSFFKFLAMARTHLDIGMPYFIDRAFDELKDAKNLFDLLPKLSSINPWQMLGPHDMVMRKFFKDPRLRAAFTFQDLYVGLSPGRAPAVFSLLAGTELTDGVWYPRGGFQKVRDGLESAIISCGVDVRTNSEVESIKVESDGAVEGVTTTNGDFFEADVVVCNRDLPAAYSLLHQSSVPTVSDHAANQTKKLANLKYSVGVIAYNWCIKGKLNDKLAHHNVFLSEKFEAAWKPAATPQELAQFPNFYCHVPSVTDPTAAPEGCESVMILLPVAHMQLKSNKYNSKPNSSTDNDSSTDYDDLVAAGRQKIIDSFIAAGVGDVSSMIANEMVITPPQWKERYGVQHGAAFGLSHTLDQLSLFRPSNKDDVVQGLYFVGASTRPGNGVPLCFIGAKLTAERILKDYGLNV
jgi:phytoene desaturase (3,4-didehydrolycopene-forming)